MAHLESTRVRVLKHMIADCASTRADLCRGLGLSKASIGRAVQALLAEDLLIEAERVRIGDRGRKTACFEVRRNLAYSVGADLEGLAVRACVLDAARNLIHHGERPVLPRWQEARIFAEWIDLIQEVIRHAGIPAEKIVGLGVGLPGKVSRDGWRIRAYLPPGRWIEHEVATELAPFALPVTAANNAICVAEFERRSGEARNAASFASVLVRYGIGVALYAGGSFLAGEETFTGELGHMCVNAEGPVCVCGRRGCLDVYVSGRTLPESETDIDTLDSAALNKRMRYLALGTANLLKVFHPPLVVLNGIYNARAERVERDLTAALREELAPIGLSVPRVAFGKPNNLKTSIGAAYRAMDAFLESYLMERVIGKPLSAP